jgi:hypothetical protein
MDNKIPEELTLQFHAEKTINYLAGLITGEISPSCEADRKFLDGLMGEIVKKDVVLDDEEEEEEEEEEDVP